ncbi:unnamed protein product [Choristocarpus tenellus]
MVKRAVTFLRHEKVRDAAKTQKVAFLKGKNLTEEEIEESLKRALSMGGNEAVTGEQRRIMLSNKVSASQSDAVVTGGMVYISGQTASQISGSDEEVTDDAIKAKDAEAQTVATLEKIEQLLKAAGSSKEKVVLVTIFVQNLEQDLEGVERAWNAWVVPGKQPARTCLQGISGEGLRVQIQVVARA